MEVRVDGEPCSPDAVAWSSSTTPCCGVIRSKRFPTLPRSRVGGFDASRPIGADGEGYIVGSTGDLRRGGVVHGRLSGVRNHAAGSGARNPFGAVGYFGAARSAGANATAARFHRIDATGRVQRGSRTGLLPMLVNADHAHDKDVMTVMAGMAERIGKDAFIRQQTAIMTRPDRPSRSGADSLPDPGRLRSSGFADPSGPASRDGRGHSQGVMGCHRGLWASFALGTTSDRLGALLRYWLQTG